MRFVEAKAAPAPAPVVPPPAPPTAPPAEGAGEMDAAAAAAAVAAAAAAAAASAAATEAAEAAAKEAAAKAAASAARVPPALAPYVARLDVPNAKELVRQFVALRTALLVALIEAEHALRTKGHPPDAGGGGAARRVAGNKPTAADLAPSAPPSLVKVGIGYALEWPAPRAHATAPVDTSALAAYEVQLRRLDAPAEPKANEWQPAHRDALREPLAPLAKLGPLPPGALAFRVRGYCGAYGWSEWSAPSEPITLWRTAPPPAAAARNRRRRRRARRRRRRRRRPRRPRRRRGARRRRRRRAARR